ncbi:DUF2924 domain-containing protein [Sphingosinicella xenopeptidilytica]|uniref:DUF2924 domain-containing protein n=1 Tax=Sphingosinicella xenopeptidilytica TaxID=364098 RepID=A0ABW3C4P6_SPHXN
MGSRLDRLETLSPAALRTAWQEHVGMPPPRLPHELLLRDLAYRLQEKRHGSLPAATLRALQRTREGRPSVPVAAAMGDGTQFVRTWHGHTIVVTKQGRDYVHDGRHYDSLTQVAREVTGARWSGPRFFGLVKRGSKPATTMMADGSAG